MEEELVREIGKEFQIVDPRQKVLNSLILVEVYTERLVEFYIGGPDYYFKRGYESHQAEYYGDTNT